MTIDPLSVIAAVKNKLPPHLCAEIELSVRGGVDSDFATVWCKHRGKFFTCVITDMGFQHLEESARDIANFIMRSMPKP